MVPRSSIVFLLLVILTRSAAQPSLANKQHQQVDSLLKTIYSINGPGASIAIIQNGKLAFANGYGLAAYNTMRNLDVNTNFNIGSLTKQFTALGILQLAENKKLSIDDHLIKFFPAMNKKIAEVITIRELLTHSSGIIDHYDLTDTKNLKHAHIGDVLNAIQNTDSTYFTPGEQFRYSNTAYNLLSLIIEQLSGMSYSEYLRKNIFSPLGMKKTVVWNEKDKIEHEATGYEFDSSTNSFRRSGANENIFFSTEGDGGIYTSVNDYLKWFSALQSGKIFPKQMVHQARSPQFSIDEEKHLSYGYGWFVDESSASAIVYHSGSNGGFRAYSFSIPEKNFLILILSNRDDIDLEKLVKQIFNICSI